jgi:NADH:ubiquinone oxidoreductase subunit 2 (subunit N)
MDLTIKDNTEFRKVIMKNLIVWLSLLSMAGIPPLGGFIAKLLALKSFFNYFSVLVILIIIIFTIIAVVVYIRPIMTKD